MPQIVNIEDLKNPKKLSEKCKNSNEPIFIENDGVIEMVAMSIELYDKTFGELIDITAKRVLEKYKPAFTELAK